MGTRLLTRRFVVGQEKAIQEIVRTCQVHMAGLSPGGRPIGNFLFLGPTGSGKTRIVEATAQALLNNPRAVIKIDCAEFQHSHEIAKLIGSPPGYLGHRETHALLSQEALNQHHTEKMKLSLVLFDEIELAGGMEPAMARLTLARKIAAIALKIWKKGERFDPAKLKQQAA